MIHEYERDFWDVVIYGYHPHEVGIAHGVNCMGVMGAGFAKELKKIHPTCYPPYAKKCKENGFLNLLGTVQHVQLTGKTSQLPMFHIFHIFTQRAFNGAEYQYVISGLQGLRRRAEKEEVRLLMMPRIGCGLGGLSWDKQIRPQLEKIFDGSNIRVEVYHLPETKNEPK